MSDKKETKVIDLMERVEVTHTEKSFGETGSTSMVSPRVAEKGMKAGFYESSKKKSKE